jgi:hypothetical protein
MNRYVHIRPRKYVCQSADERLPRACFKLCNRTVSTMPRFREGSPCSPAAKSAAVRCVETHEPFRHLKVSFLYYLASGTYAISGRPLSSFLLLKSARMAFMGMPALGCLRSPRLGIRSEASRWENLLTPVQEKRHGESVIEELEEVRLA